MNKLKLLLVAIGAAFGVAGQTVMAAVPEAATNFTDAATVATGVANGGLNVWYIVLPSGLVVGLTLWGIRKWKATTK